eukprot:CAMPEP_0182423566 /NCGR_PEP_ID=MMETSP1167-20130531/9601_1 /TAXON_ID=2988 /ORGANISM="Mallomonas Sp, Strain CCMP3275" /LENGTH=513 /DNA_ID=CAMNT_0024602663 /DNA_START=115 /DNA_END=1656 /DNA_ORIENTATION=-
MDAEYLRKNVNVALMESLASMAIAKPDDCVDYIGKYLLQYVERGALKFKEKDVLDKVINNAVVYEKEEQIRVKELAEERAKQEAYDAQLPTFLSTLEGVSISKQDCMDKCTQFLANYLDVPATYIAVKRVVNDIEALYYVSANIDQHKVILGQKLVRAADDSDEPMRRQGFSFDAFNIPEPSDEPEEAEEEDEESSQEPRAPKPPPGPQPYIVDNVMRESRTKFFGIPKLGAFVGIPLPLESIDHDGGCQSASGDLHRGPFSKNKISTPMLLCMDTIGKYRSFTPNEINVAKQVAEKMMELIINMENKMFIDHEAYLNKQVHDIKSILDLSVKTKDMEEAAVAALAPESEGDHADAARMLHEAEARLSVWSSAIQEEPFQPVFCGLDEHILPLPQIVCHLLYAVGCFVGLGPDLFKDPSGDVSWEKCKKLLYHITTNAGKFAPSAEMAVSKEGSWVGVKTFSEANGLMDPLFPSYLPVLPVLHTWLMKALTARELAIAFKLETEKIEIEMIQG